MFKKPVIVFEGIECSGKTYHHKTVSNYLKKRKIDFISIREPGGSKNSEKIRKLILSNRSSFNSETDLFLYLAARSENLDLLKKYYKKKVILIDRFVDSTIAYQHYGLGVNLRLIKFLNKSLLKKIKIDLTFINTVSQKNMIKRLNQRKQLNRYDKFNYSFYKKVQKGFLQLAKKKTRKYKIINSNLDISYNKSLILKRVEKLL